MLRSGCHTCQSFLMLCSLTTPTPFHPNTPATPHRVACSLFHAVFKQLCVEDLFDVRDPLSQLVKLDGELCRKAQAGSGNQQWCTSWVQTYQPQY